ncbi:MAG: GIY-YIG nuclease family protein [Methanophagales archaeon]|nr:GIY-YIG nuclease family protein [Methanophagales archaeon]
MIYLLHFERPINPDRPARHYVGYTRNLAARIQSHRAGNSARLLEVAHQRGIKFEITRVWEGSRADERKLKNHHNTPRYCPLCNATPRSLPLRELTPEEIKNELLPF